VDGSGTGARFLSGTRNYSAKRVSLVWPFIERVPQGLSQRRERDRLIFDCVKYPLVCGVFWIIFAVPSDSELQKTIRGALIHIRICREIHRQQ
jgi:hypothetical protein